LEPGPSSGGPSSTTVAAGGPTFVSGPGRSAAVVVVVGGGWRNPGRLALTPGAAVGAGSLVELAGVGAGVATGGEVVIGIHLDELAAIGRIGAGRGRGRVGLREARDAAAIDVVSAPVLRAFPAPRDPALGRRRGHHVPRPANALDLHAASHAAKMQAAAASTKVIDGGGRRRIITVADPHPTPAADSVDPITVRLHAAQRDVEVAEEALDAARLTRQRLVVIAADDQGLSRSRIASATGLSHAAVHKILAKPAPAE
jgi:hypothetical protein